MIFVFIVLAMLFCSWFDRKYWEEGQRASFGDCRWQTRLR